MRFRVGACLWVAAIGAQAVGAASAADAVALVRDGLAQHRTDGSLAKALHKLALKERLESGVAEELESLGAGPKTVGELEAQCERTAQLAPPAQPLDFAYPAPPTRAAQIDALESARSNANAYEKGLPDFLCDELIHRYEAASGDGGWRLKDILLVHLNYVDHAEDYRLVTVNSRPAQGSVESAGGAVSEGEFGSLLAGIFDPRSKTQFRWERWGHLRGHLALVFAFHVALEHSAYHLWYGSRPTEISATAGQNGWIYAGQEGGGRILRLREQAAEIPPDFPVRAASTLVDYDVTQIGGQPFLLPLRAEVRLATRRLATRNTVKFENYRKFTGESSIRFDSPK